MAVRTYAQLISDITTYLTQKVTIVKHSALATNIIDTLFDSGNGSGARPYKVYTALLTQGGTDAPVPIVLENTLGGTPVWSYEGVGNYNITLAGAFTANKTTIEIKNHVIGDGTGVAHTIFAASPPDFIAVYAYDYQNNTSNYWGALNPAFLSIEIRVYY